MPELREGNDSAALVDSNDRIPASGLQTKSGVTETDSSANGITPLSADLIKSIEAQTREENVSQAMDFLEKRGLIRRTQDGVIICDIDKLRQPLRYKEMRTMDKLGPIVYLPTTGTRSKDRLMIDVFTDIFSGVKVFSEEDYKRFKAGEAVDPRDLFYTPEDEYKATDIDAIRESRFYMLPQQLSTTHYPKLHNSRSSKSRPGFHEATAACLIFHPQYGNGERGEDGTLYVTFGNGDRQPISVYFFVSWGYHGTHKYMASAKPSTFFLKMAPGMVEKGLIQPWKDFRMVEDSPSSMLAGLNYRKPTDKGMVMLDEIRFTIGTEFAGSKGYAVVRVSDLYAAIIDYTDAGTPQVVKVFEIAGPNADKARRAAQRESAERGKKIYPRVGKKILKDQMYDLEELRKQDASMHYLARNFASYIEFSQRFSIEAGSAMSGLTAKEQAFAVSLYLNYSESSAFWNFLKEYKLTGLKVLMLASGEEHGVEEILGLSERLGRAICSTLFEESAKILTALSEFEEKKREMTDEAERSYLEHATDTVLQQARKVLLFVVPLTEGKLQNKVQNIELWDVVNLLTSFRERVQSQYGHVLEDNSEYSELLDFFSRHSSGDPLVRSIALLKIQQNWRRDLVKEALRGGGNLPETYKELEAFYSGNSELYSSASETTGDTQQEIKQFNEYDSKEPVRGLLVDLGCGIGRLTEPRARTLSGRAKVIGVDLHPPESSSEPNLHYIKSDIRDIPIESNSVDVVTADWSVLNDALSRSQHLQIFSEVSRMLKTGGRFRFDVPNLEGGEGSWESEARNYHEHNQGSRYGTIEADFPSPSGLVRKKFYIYPRRELEALLRSHGFAVEKVLEWTTRSGKPRLTFETRLKHKVTPLTFK